MKNEKIISVVLTLTLLAGILMLSGCSLKTEKLDTAALLGNYNIEELKGTEINVYNWGEYISDGEGGSVDVISEFEKLTGIKVNYNMYDSNEDLYAKLKSGGVNYDVIIPSDYMAERLKNEGLLQKLDYSVITNYEGIGDEYKTLFFDENNEYTVAYTGVWSDLSIIRPWFPKSPTAGALCGIEIFRRNSHIQQFTRRIRCGTVSTRLRCKLDESR